MKIRVVYGPPIPTANGPVHEQDQHECKSYSFHEKGGVCMLVVQRTNGETYTYPHVGALLRVEEDPYGSIERPKGALS